MTKSLQDRVDEAAERLIAQGRKVTTESVRLEIGGGSLRDISPAIRAWREKQQAAETATSMIPAEMVSVIERASALIWGEAEKRAGEQVSAIRAKSAEHIAEVESERDEALNDIARLEAALAESKQESDALRAELAKTSARAERAEAQVQANQAAEARLVAEVAQANAAADKARDSERVARDQAAEFRGRIAALEQQLERLEKARDERPTKK